MIFSKHKVYQLYPSNVDDLTAIIKLHNEGEVGSFIIFKMPVKVDFWKAPTVENSNVDVMIKPSQLAWFGQFLNKTSIEYKVLVEDLEK